MNQQLIYRRFELFIVSQIAILFGSLIIPSTLGGIIPQILFYLNVLAGSLFIGTGKTYHLKLVILISLVGGLLVIGPRIFEQQKFMGYITFILLFIFHAVVTYQIIRQIWNSEKVDKTVILGMMSGYLSLGIIGFFIYLSQEILNPGSFSGLLIEDGGSNNLTERLMYFSYITLMTIGYGEITPVKPLAQKATILVGLMGQFYLVIITAIVVGKFINQSSNKKIQNS